MAHTLSLGMVYPSIYLSAKLPLCRKGGSWHWINTISAGRTPGNSNAKSWNWVASALSDTISVHGVSTSGRQPYHSQGPATWEYGIGTSMPSVPNTHFDSKQLLARYPTCYTRTRNPLSGNSIKEYLVQNNFKMLNGNQTFTFLYL